MLSDSFFYNLTFTFELMNDRRYKLILYIIVFVILGTISIQVYWNYKNYLVNKQQLINDVQVSLDNAVETYYANLAEKSTIAFSLQGDSLDLFDKNLKFDSILHSINFSRRGIRELDSLNIDGISIYKGFKADSIFGEFHDTYDIDPNNRSAIIKGLINSESDTILQDNLKMLTSKVVFSMTIDTLLLEEIDVLLITELQRKSLALDYGLSFNTPFADSQYINKNNVESSSLSTLSKSPYLPNESELTIYFKNETKIILKRILSGIIISLLLVLVVISCLFYLLKIIKHQKQLAEVKNDLISNITHEFKTPIATISVALESIKNFNVIDDKEKTKTYLDMSKDQLSKLNVMVEKLLETATLDSESLELNKEPTNISDLLTTIIDKHQIQTEAKTIIFNPSEEEIIANVDVFHIENAINNIIDNALKYGGEIISIDLKKHSNQVEISISDSGKSLTKANKDKIFEKFYRVSKGNTHDVKGFGIGLYYSKKIVEKHGGTIHLDLDTNLTTFKISLPND